MILRFITRDYNTRERQGARQFRNIDLRCVEIDGKPWFLGADVLNVIYGQASGRSHIYRTLAETEVRKVDRIHFGQAGKGVMLISESALYKFIMRSDKPEAKDFQHWVTSVVLPAIRKDGKRPG